MHSLHAQRTPCFLVCAPPRTPLPATGAPSPTRRHRCMMQGRAPRARRFIEPTVFNNFESGATAVAEGLVIFPAAITVAPIDTQIDAIGGLIAPTLLSITPVRELHLRTGLTSTPVELAVVLAPPAGNGTAPAPAPGAPGAPAASAAPADDADDETDSTSVTGAGRAAGVGG